MATVLDGDTVWQSNTSFSYDKTYKTATNPILKLEDIGMIGLPLSERDALVIKDHANQAAFGVGQRKGRKPASDTWEMDAGKVMFFIISVLFYGLILFFLGRHQQLGLGTVHDSRCQRSMHCVRSQCQAKI